MYYMATMAKRPKRKGRKRRRKQRGQGFGPKTSHFPGLAGNVARRKGLVKKKHKKGSKLASYRSKGSMGNNGDALNRHYNPKAAARSVMKSDGIVRSGFPIEQEKLKPALLRFME